MAKGVGRGVTEATAVTVGLNIAKGVGVGGTSLNIAKGAVINAVDQVQLALEEGGLKSLEGPGGIYETHTAEESMFTDYND